MANTSFPNLCELFQIINNVGYKGSFLEPLAMTQMETQGENKGELPIKKYQTDLDISELEIIWSSPPICQGTVEACKGHEEHKTHTPWKTVDSWEPADQEIQENIIAKCKIFSKSQQLTCKKLAFNDEQLK